jgi:isoquinoline 1-oxidoreductase beta subunit
MNERERDLAPPPAGSTLSRREFLRAGALTGAGLVIAVHLPAPLRAAAAKPEAGRLEPNAYLRVAPDGTVTVLIARTEMGQGSSTALAMLVAEELGAEWGRVRIEQAIPAKVYGDMSTGGSRAIRSLWKPMRLAGAQAREVLIAAAAAQWKVAAAACRAEAGAVVHAASGRRLAFGALVAAAAKLPLPAAPTLREQPPFRVIGTSPARLDGPAKVVGAAVFGADVRVPGMLYAAVAQSPVFGGKATGFDPAAALAVPGVVRVERVGDDVAVLARGTWAALRGRRALRVTWDEGALATLDSAGIRARFAELAQGPGEVVRREGRGAAALDGAARTLEAVYEVPYLAHAPMEPMNCTAQVRDGRCEVWVPTQSGSGAWAAAAEAAGLPPESVTVHMTQAGGGFGRRHQHDYVVQAVRLSKTVGATVQVVWTRDDDLRHDFYRPATYNVLRAGLDADGNPVAWTHRIVAPGIATYLGYVEKGQRDWSSTDGAENLPYAIPNLEVDLHTSDPGVPLGWWRSVASSQNAYVTECFLDEVAAAAGRDPYELRRALLAKQPRHLAVLDAAARAAGWGTPPPAGLSRGIAVHACFGSFVAQVAEVEVGDGGAVRVRRVVCAVDCGTVVHPDLVRQQMEGGILYGLSAALREQVTIERGRVVQANFDEYPVLAIDRSPVIEVHLVPSGDAVGGIGEPGLPPIAPAVANAVAKATGRPVRRLPILATA